MASFCSAVQNGRRSGPGNAAVTSCLVLVKIALCVPASLSGGLCPEIQGGRSTQYLHGCDDSPPQPSTSAIVKDIGGGMSMIQMDNGQSGVAIKRGRRKGGRHNRL